MSEQAPKLNINASRGRLKMDDSWVASEASVGTFTDPTQLLLRRTVIGGHSQL